MTDLQLLHEYAASNSEEAFRELACRYTSLVYSSALRQTGERTSAEEITQAVFILLAHKASGFRPESVLSGWLLRTTHYVALNARRRELRRRHFEEQAMSLYPTESEAAWNRLAPLLDEALARLSERDRDALTLRFFEEKSFREIGQAIGITEDNAQKRVSRALERLRAAFTKRGVVLPAALVAGTIHARAVHAAPEALSAAVTSTVMLGAAGTGLVSELADLTLARWAAARLRMLAFRGATVVLLVAMTWLGVRWLSRSQGGRLAGAGRGASTNLPGDAQPPSPADLPLKQPTSETANLGSLRFQVMDTETRRPVPGARMTAVWSADSPERRTNITTTDLQGTALLAIERRATGDWGYCIEVYRDGYVPKYVSWSQRQGDAPKDIPAEYSTLLTPAVSIGAQVVNEAGEPVPGARVVFDVRKYGAPAESLDRERLTMTSHYHVELTDSEGRWHCSHVPAQFAMVEFKVAHPDYAPGQFGSAALGATTNHGILYLAQTDLRNETAVMPLSHGSVAAGVVVDEAGNPVAGAKVTFEHGWFDPTASQITEPDGRFRFRNIPARPQRAPQDTICFLTVQAEGYSPTDRRFKGSVPPAETRFTLSRGAELRGRVVHENGQPVPKATIQICSHSNVKRFEWTTTTDAEGRFQWDSAPRKPEFYVVEASGYQPMAEVKWAPDGTEHLLTLHANPPPVRVFGTVVDDATGKPLDHFQVWMSFVEKRYTGYAQPMDSARPARLRATGNLGQFSFTNQDPFVAFTLEVRADGYCTGQKSERRSPTNDLKCDFRLEAAIPLIGEVHLADGTPAAGAVAMMTTEFLGVYMKLPGQFDLSLSGGPHVETDALGRFSFPPTKGATDILIFSPAGFASVSPTQLAASSVVTLQPWGRVMGVLKIGSQPGANQTIDLSYLPRSTERLHRSLFLETRTDAEGRFVFEGVPPWPLQVAHRLAFRDGQGGPIPQTQQTPIQVQARQTTYVTLGGSGCKVVGKLSLGSEQPPRQVDWQFDVQTLTTKPAGVTPAPKPDAFATPAEFHAAWKQWGESQDAFWQSAAGQEAQRRRREYVLVFDKDGSFKIDDVLPGTYELRIGLSDPGKPVAGSFAFSYASQATLTKEIVIPEPASGQEAAPVDLGVLELK